MTEWRDVVGWEGFYKVSSSGMVASLDRTVQRKDGTSQTFAGHAMTPTLNSKGYLSVRLSAPGRRKYAPVHRLVALAFIPNPLALREVNHRDAVKQNNASANLEWVDSSDNKKHAWRMGLRKSVPFLPSPPDLPGQEIPPQP